MGIAATPGYWQARAEQIVPAPRTLLDLHLTGELIGDFHLAGTKDDHDQSTHAGGGRGVAGWRDGDGRIARVDGTILTREDGLAARAVADWLDARLTETSPRKTRSVQAGDLARRLLKYAQDDVADDLRRILEDDADPAVLLERLDALFAQAPPPSAEEVQAAVASVLDGYAAAGPPPSGFFADRPPDVIKRQQAMLKSSNPVERAIAVGTRTWSGTTHGVREFRKQLVEGDGDALLFRDAIRAAPAAAPELFRGMTAGRSPETWARWENLEIGDTIDLEQVGSFTESQTHAGSFGRIAVTMKPGAAALPIQTFSNTPLEREWLVAGDVRVTKITPTGPGREASVPSGELWPFEDIEIGPGFNIEVEYIGPSDEPHQVGLAAAGSTGILDLIAELLGTPLHLDSNHPVDLPPIDPNSVSFHLQGQHDQQTHGRRYGGPEMSRPDNIGYGNTWRIGTDDSGRPAIERQVYAYTGWDNDWGGPDTESPVEARWAVDGRGEGDGSFDYAPPPSADVAARLSDDEVAAVRAELDAADRSVLQGAHMDTPDGFAADHPASQHIDLSLTDSLILNELNAHLVSPLPSGLADKYRPLLAAADMAAIRGEAIADFAITPESALIYTVGSNWNASALSKLGVAVGLGVDPDAYGYMQSTTKPIGNQRAGNPQVDYGRAKEIRAALPTSLSSVTTAVNRHTQDVMSEMYPSGEVPVYRGVTRPAVEGTVSINPVSSWSLEAQWAANFGERTVKSTVLVESVFSYGAATGWGAQSEAEVILSTPSRTVTIDEVRTDRRWEFTTDGSVNIDEGEEDWIKAAALSASAAEFHLQGEHDQKTHGNRGSRLGPRHMNERARFKPPTSWRDAEDVEEAVNAMCRQLSADRDDDIFYEFKDVEFTHDEAHITMSIRTDQDPYQQADGYIGEALRRVAFDGSYMIADTLRVDSNYRGRGAGTDLQEGFEDLVAASGVPEVRVSAVSIGKYAWARAGYDWNMEEGQRFTEISNYIKGAVRTGRLAPSETADRYAAAFDAAPSLLADHQNLYDGTPVARLPTPFEVSELLGRDLMTGGLGGPLDTYRGVGVFPAWDGRKQLTDLALAASAGEDRLAAVRAAYAAWWPIYPVAADPTDNLAEPGADAALSALVNPEIADLAMDREMADRPLTRIEFHLAGTKDDHDQSTHAGGGVDPTSPAARKARGWQKVTDIESDRPVEFFEYENTYRVTAADGTHIEAFVLGYGDTSAHLRTPEWRERIVGVLNGTTDAYDAAPSSTPPRILVLPELPFDMPAHATKAVAMVNTGRGMAEGGQTRPSDLPWSLSNISSNEILVNATPAAEEVWAVYEERGAEIMMPSVTGTTVARYTGAHEFGHVRAGLGDDPVPLIFSTYDSIRPYDLGDPFTPAWRAASRYAKTTPFEAHAEAFAEWVLTDGASTNDMTAVYDEVFEWGTEADTALAASAGPDIPDWLFDGPDGPSEVSETGAVTVYEISHTGGLLPPIDPNSVSFHLAGTKDDHDQQSHAGSGQTDPGIRSDGARFEYDSISSLADQYDINTHITDAQRFKHEGAARVVAVMGEEDKQAIADELNQIIIGDLDGRTGAILSMEVENQVSSFGLALDRMPLGVAMQAASLAKAWALDYPKYDVTETFQAAVDAFNAGGDPAVLSAAMDELGISVAHGAVDWRNSQWQQASVTPAMVAFHLGAASQYKLYEASRALTSYYPSGSYAIAEDIQRMIPETIRSVLSADRWLVEDSIQMGVRRDSRDTVTLYRGVKDSGHQATNMDSATAVQTNPLSSWTSDRRTAESFAGQHSTNGGWLIEAEIPADQIIAMASLNGWGSLKEREVIVMGRPTATSSVTPINKDRP